MGKTPKGAEGGTIAHNYAKKLARQLNGEPKSNSLVSYVDPNSHIRADPSDMPKISAGDVFSIDTLSPSKMSKKRKVDEVAEVDADVSGHVRKVKAVAPNLVLPHDDWFLPQGTRDERNEQCLFLKQSLIKPWYRFGGKSYATWDPKLLVYTEDIHAFWHDVARGRFLALDFAKRWIAYCEIGKEQITLTLEKQREIPLMVTITDSSHFNRFRKLPGSDTVVPLPLPSKARTCKACGLCTNAKQLKCACDVRRVGLMRGSHEEECPSACVCGAAFESRLYKKTLAHAWTGDPEADADIVLCTCMCTCSTEMDREIARQARQELQKQMFDKYIVERPSVETRAVLQSADDALAEKRSRVARGDPLPAFDIDAWWTLDEVEDQATTALRTAAHKLEILKYWNTHMPQYAVQQAKDEKPAAVAAAAKHIPRARKGRHKV